LKDGREKRMKIDRRLFIVFIVVLVLIPGAYGGSVSVGCGSSVALSGGSSAEGILASNGLVTQSSASSSGVIDNLNIDPWVKNIKGDYAEVGVTGTNIAGFSYNSNVYPGEGSGWDSTGVWAYQSLSASSADYLHAYALASNAAGDEAHSTMDVTSGSIGNYYSGAYAGSDSWSGYAQGAYTQQIAKYINGNDILVQSWTKNANSLGDQASAKTEVVNGDLVEYSDQANAVKYWGYGYYYGYGPSAAGVSVNSLSASALTGTIDQILKASDYFGDTTETSTNINGGNLYSSYSNSYSEGENGGTTGAYQSMDAYGNNIGCSAKIANQLLGTFSNSQQFSNKYVNLWNSASSSFNSVYLNFGLST
jgi:hypothetical protein